MGDPFLERFRAVKAEDFARAGLGVAGIGEAGDDASAFVEEWQRLAVADPFELGRGVAFGLFLDLGDLVAKLFLLGLDDADGFFIDEKDVIGRADVGLVFANRNPRAGAEVDLLCRLNDPAGKLELRVDVVAGLLFRVLVFGHSFTGLVSDAFIASPHRCYMHRNAELCLTQSKTANPKVGRFFCYWSGRRDSNSLPLAPHKGNTSSRNIQ